MAVALLAQGAELVMWDRGGKHPLMHAATRSRTKTFELLLVRGADATSRRLVGSSEIDWTPKDVWTSSSEPAKRHRGVAFLARRSHSNASYMTASSRDITNVSS